MLPSPSRRSRTPSYLPPPRRKSLRPPACKDYFSGLPFELFLAIVDYTIDDTSAKPLASFKSLSVCNKTIRAKSVSSGLFRSFLVTPHHGTGTIREINQRLLFKTIPQSTIHTLTISESIISECPSELAKLLQLLQHLRVLRIKGPGKSDPSITWSSSPRLKCGRLVSFNGLLHKSLSTRLQTLDQLEIIDCSVTQIHIDIIVTIKSYKHLVLRSCEFLEDPDLMWHTNRNVRTVQMERPRLGIASPTSQFLKCTRICATVEFLSFPAAYFGSILAHLTNTHHDISAPGEIFPKLKTVYLLPGDLYPLRSRTERRKLIFKTLVWRIRSFLRPIHLDHVLSLPSLPATRQC